MTTNIIYKLLHKLSQGKRTKTDTNFYWGFTTDMGNYRPGGPKLFSEVPHQRLKQKKSGSE